MFRRPTSGQHRTYRINIVCCLCGAPCIWHGNITALQTTLNLSRRLEGSRQPTHAEGRRIYGVDELTSGVCLRGVSRGVSLGCAGMCVSGVCLWGCVSGVCLWGVFR